MKCTAKKLKRFATKMKNGTIKLSDDLVKQIKKPEEQFSISPLVEKRDVKEKLYSFALSFDKRILINCNPKLYEKLDIPCPSGGLLFGTEDDFKIANLKRWCNICKGFRNQLNAEKLKLNAFIVATQEKQLEQTHNVDFATMLFPQIMLYVQEKYTERYKMLDDNAKLCEKIRKQAKSEIAFLEKNGNLMFKRTIGGIKNEKTQNIN